MKKSAENEDRNFDSLADKFQRKVYGQLKGRIRLAVLKKDLNEFYPAAIETAGKMPLKILDAGSGNAPFSLYLAQIGHHVTLCDISSKMLDMAREQINQHAFASNIKIVHTSIQSLPVPENRYDLVLCHAVLEWVADPQALIAHLLRQLKDGGILSLTFYNLNGMIFKNLLRTNYKKIVNKKYKGWPGSLTPTNPLDPEIVHTWIQSHPVELLCRSGMRVFHDYVLDLKDREKAHDTVVKLELEFCRKPPYRDLGRYMHYLIKKL